MGKSNFLIKYQFRHNGQMYKSEFLSEISKPDEGMLRHAAHAHLRNIDQDSSDRIDFISIFEVKEL